MIRSIVAGGALFAVSSIALAGTLSPGVYKLANHPDGNAQPPQYGLRLDELYNATGSHDIFTFDFDDPISDVHIMYNGSAIKIYGSAVGGRDIGGAYAADPYFGIYTFEMSYTIGVMPVPGDDDIWVDAPNHANSGWIKTPLGDTKILDDERGGNPYSIRIGDENDDLGHRGFPGISGWGWLRVDGVHTDNQDFLFTVVIPSPGSLAMLGLGGLLALRRRR